MSRHPRTAFLLLICLTAAPAAATPQLSDEIVLDHGFRYHNPNDESAGTALALDGSRVLVSYVSLNEGDVVGYRRGLDGGEIDLVPGRIGRSPEEGFSGDHDISVLDPAGWKLVFGTGGPSGSPATGLYARNIDPQTLQSTGEVVLAPEGDPRIYHPTISGNGAAHVVLWLETSGGGLQLLLRRLAPDLTLPDPAPVQVAPAAALGTVGVATRSSGGMVAWVSAALVLSARPLGGDGLPNGALRAIEQGAGTSPAPEVALCGLGENYLLVWRIGAQPIKWAVLDPSAQLIGPIRSMSGTCHGGLAVCEGSGSGLLAWRDGWEVNSARVSPAGLLLGTALVDDAAGLEYWNDLLARNLDSVWTGARYVVAWNSLYPPPPGGPSRPWGSGVFASWIDPDGVPGPRVDITSGSRPWGGAPGNAGGDFRCFIQDRYASMVHTVGVTDQGVPTGEPNRFAGPYGLWSEVVVRPWIQAGTAGYAVASSVHETSNGPIPPTDRQTVAADLTDASGSVLHHVERELGLDPLLSVPHLDVATREDSIVLIHQIRYEGSGSTVEADLFLANGTQIRNWTIAGSDEQEQPTIIPASGGYLAVWSDRRSGSPQLYKSMIYPGSPGNALSGAPLSPQSGEQTEAFLAAGPGQVLCVWTLTRPFAPTGADICALRLSPEGVPLDPAPLVVCQASGDQSGPQAAWSGASYLITWGAETPPRQISANRVSLSGELLDGAGFIVGTGSDSRRAPVASDGDGTLLVRLDGGRIRFVYDPVAADSDGTFPDPAALLGAVYPVPNPTPGGVTLRIPGLSSSPIRAILVDAAGRTLLSLPRRALGSEVLWWDGLTSSGRPAPPGVYYLSMRTPGGEVVRPFVVVR